MISPSDEIILKKKGITLAKMTEQLKTFATGFPYLEIRDAAKLNKGIVSVNEAEIPKLMNEWNEYLQSGATVIKFVPASGAASRMFKELFELLERDNAQPLSVDEKKFFAKIKHLAFYEELDAVCIQNDGKSVEELIESNQYKAVAENLLLDNGLHYGSLPKGLLKFHSYPTEKRTPAQEHLVEGALYAATNSGKVNIHFTVSGEHRLLFEKHLNEIIPEYEKKLGVAYQVTFSEQKSSTDTVAVDENNQPFRERGELVFRPGGHGALIENLNDLNGNMVFIKNIDNVVPDSLKATTVSYKKVIAGLLVHLQKQCFAYLHQLEDESIPDTTLSVISEFCETQLNNHHLNLQTLSHDALKKYLITKINRPIRVCGMVKNAGEPGGGPFLTVNSDGTVSPQILESSQIDLNNPSDKEKMLHSTHFNPVDLVCSLKNYKGKKFDLTKYVDNNTGFISLKSKNGKALKALELPGLWNGAMSDWNTVFVEVPIETFNPVKTVHDLLRREHQ